MAQPSAREKQALGLFFLKVTALVLQAGTLIFSSAHARTPTASIT
jgi:hypothetical protein